MKQWKFAGGAVVRKCSGNGWVGVLHEKPLDLLNCQSFRTCWSPTSPQKRGEIEAEGEKRERERGGYSWVRLRWLKGGREKKEIE